MSKLPIAAPHSEGRIFGTDWSIANVATLLRSNASRGMWRTGGTGGYNDAINKHYLRTASARHMPTSVSLIFLKLQDESWYLSICFAGADDYLPWNVDAAELWLWALFDQNRPHAVEEVVSASVRQYKLGKPPQ